MRRGGKRRLGGSVSKRRKKQPSKVTKKEKKKYPKCQEKKERGMHPVKLQGKKGSTSKRGTREVHEGGGKVTRGEKRKRGVSARQKNYDLLDLGEKKGGESPADDEATREKGRQRLRLTPKRKKKKSPRPSYAGGERAPDKGKTERRRGLVAHKGGCCLQGGEKKAKLPAKSVGKATPASTGGEKNA